MHCSNNHIRNCNISCLVLMQPFIKNNKIKIRDVNSWENGKIHYWAESHNSQIETLDFALVRTFYWHARSLIAGGAPRGGAIAGWPLTPLPGSLTSLTKMSTYNFSTFYVVDLVINYSFLLASCYLLVLYWMPFVILWQIFVVVNLGAVVLGRYAQRKLLEYQDREAAEYLANFRLTVSFWYLWLFKNCNQSDFAKVIVVIALCRPRAGIQTFLYFLMFILWLVFW